MYKLEVDGYRFGIGLILEIEIRRELLDKGDKSYSVMCWMLCRITI